MPAAFISYCIIFALTLGHVYKHASGQTINVNELFSFKVRYLVFTIINFKKNRMGQAI